MSNDKTPIAIVTGGSSGIGGAIVHRIAASGGEPVVWSRRTGVDVTDGIAVQQAMASVVAAHGRVDAVINNAGVAMTGGISSMPLDQWGQMMSVNLFGAINVARAVIPVMRSQRYGKIINIASTSGIGSRPGWAGYAASKAAMISFSQAMSDELRPYGIRTYCLCPGRTNTDLRRALVPQGEDPNTLMSPEAVADVVLFCLSTEGDTIEGQPILVRERFGEGEDKCLR